MERNLLSDNQIIVKTLEQYKETKSQLIYLYEVEETSFILSSQRFVYLNQG
jgi:hypothetical protein